VALKIKGIAAGVNLGPAHVDYRADRWARPNRREARYATVFFFVGLWCFCGVYFFLVLFEILGF